MNSRGGKFFPCASLADQNHWPKRTGNASDLLLKPKEHVARTERLNGSFGAR